MRVNWRAVLGIVLSAAFLYWALHDIDPDEVMAHLRQSNVWLLLASAATATLIFPLRAIRWKVILEPVLPDVRLGPLWRAVCIGMMINNVVPARVGELARAYAVTREERRLPFSASFASLAVDRVFDAVVVMLLMVLALLDPELPSASPEVARRLTHTLGLGSIFAAGVLGALYLLVFFPDAMIRWYERLTRRVAPKFEARGRAMLEAFASGLSVLRSPARFAAVFVWTLAHWMVSALAFWIGFRAVGIEASYFAALLVQGVIVVGVALPQAPGFFGVFEAAARWTLVSVYAVSADRAITWAIGYHLLSFIPITVIGAWYFVRLGLHLGEIRAETQGASTPDEALGHVSAPAARLLAQAKANLRLRILAREASRYHQLETVFLRLDLADEIVVRTGGRGRTLDCRGADVGAMEQNLAYRAAMAMREAGGPDAFAIEIDKRIPVGAGLGGGSADAAAVLRALNALRAKPLPDDGLLALAAGLGADVPFLVSGAVMALAWGRGERMMAVRPPPSRPVVVLTPPFGVATAEAYAWLDAAAPPATASAVLHSEELRDWNALAAKAHNDFEAVVAERHPEIAVLVASLRDAGASLALMSGSGSAVFGVFTEAPAALRLPPDTRIIHTASSEQVAPVARLG